MKCKKAIATGGICMLTLIPGIFNGIINITTVNVERGEKPIVNPLKGYAMSADYGKIDRDNSLVHVLIRWKDLEEKKGVYNFAKIEKENNFKYFKEKNKRFIIRIVCDYPEDEKGNITIPSWLYYETKKDGEWYNNSYGKGYSPNYENKIFIKEHEKLVKAVAHRYNKDKSIAYIQLGSIGHWGEWHVNNDEGIKRMPKSNITDKYVKQYIKYFKDKKLMMRRPFKIAKDNKMGLYNDVFGHKESTDEWLSWIKKGYVSSQTNEKIKGMPDYWKYAPSGGEVASYDKLNNYFTSRFKETHSELIKSHTTYLGPKCPIEKLEKGKLKENIETISKDMGYCFTINKYEIMKFPPNNLNLAVEWENIGIAPIYENWKVKFSLIDENDNEIAKTYPKTDITKWLPGKNKLTVSFKNEDKLATGNYKICVAIIDPITNKPGIKMALKNEYSNCTYQIGNYEVK